MRIYIQILIYTNGMRLMLNLHEQIRQKRIEFMNELLLEWNV